MLSNYFKYVHIHDDVYAVYNSLVFQPLFCSEQELNQIIAEKVTREEYENLKARHIYVDSAQDDEKAIAALEKQIKSHKQSANIMYLIVSTACNLACKYCFIEQNPNTVTCAALMSKETAKTAIDNFFSALEPENAKTAQVVVYGGEPMTNKNLLPFIFSYIREKAPATKLTMISNATLIDDETIALLCKYNVGVGISIDGPKDINDKNRVFAIGDESVYDAVTKNIKKMLENNAPFGLSITVTQDVLDNKQRVIDWIKSLGVKDIFWNLFHFSEYSPNWQKYYEEMSDFIFDANEQLLEDGIADGRMMELLGLFEKNLFRYESCGAVGMNQIAVSPDGSCFICHGDNRDPRYKIGDIHEGVDALLHSEAVKKWDGLMTIDHEKCRNCEAFFVCGGGCPAHAEVLFGSRDHLDESACIFYKKYLLWLLREYYRQTLANLKEGGNRDDRTER